MVQRNLTAGEEALLRPIFASTLPYGALQISRNDEEIGGKDNSFTPGYVPNMAKTIWRLDYSSAPNSEKWVFIHEVTHAWQAYHDHHNIINGIVIWAKHRNYDDAYFYSLDASNNFLDFNMEQQASIVPDYWYVSRKLTPQYNKGMRASLKAYEPFISQLWASGPPSGPMPRIGGDRDYIGHNI